MVLEIEVYDALCALSTFRINGIDADYEDFGNKADENPEDAEEYGCGNMIFTAKLPTDSVLEKYKITAPEYEKVANKCAELLSFGSCGWCI